MSSQSPSLCWEEVLVMNNPCERQMESQGQVFGEPQQWWGKIQVPACGTLQRSVESELCLAAKEQTLVRLVRRGALGQLLQAEHQQQQQELHQLGKAFYKERL